MGQKDKTKEKQRHKCVCGHHLLPSPSIQRHAKGRDDETTTKQQHHAKSRGSLHRTAAEKTWTIFLLLHFLTLSLFPRTTDLRNNTTKKCQLLVVSYWKMREWVSRKESLSFVFHCFFFLQVIFRYISAFSGSRVSRLTIQSNQLRQ